MSQFCMNCGRKLEDGEVQLTDGCQYCINYYGNEEKTETDDSGSAIIGAIVLIGIFWLLFKLFFGIFFG